MGSQNDQSPRKSESLSEVLKDLGSEIDITRGCFPEFLPARFSENV